MRFEALEVAGAFLVRPEPRRDERGFFARTFCADELHALDLVSHFAQSSISVSTSRGTVRGMHFSVAPHAETKIVRCTAGVIDDFLVDVRPDSSTYLRSISIPLSAENRHALYIPVGIAHGFLTLRNDTEVLYMIDVPYGAESARGLHWNDPAIDVRWREPITLISDRDLTYPAWATPTSPHDKTCARHRGKRVRRCRCCSAAARTRFRSSSGWAKPAAGQTAHVPCGRPPRPLAGQCRGRRGSAKPPSAPRLVCRARPVLAIAEEFGVGGGKPPSVALFR